MSVFDGNHHPLDWMREKALRALQESVRLVDLANEPDTTPWYSKKLRELAAGLVARLAPLVVLVYGVKLEAAEQRSWNVILDGGSLGLARWCRRWGIADPHDIGQGAVALARNEDDLDEKAELPEDDDPVTEDEVQAGQVQAQVYSAMMSHLLNESVPENSRRLLTWLLYNLPASRGPGLVEISKRFLPTDIGRSPEETAAAYQDLYERGIIERVDGLRGLSEDRLALRLVVPGITEKKHSAPFMREKFGFPGARIDGKPTMGGPVYVAVPPGMAEAVRRWAGGDANLSKLREAVQAGVGVDRALIEDVEFIELEDAPRLRVRLRSPIDADEHALVSALEDATLRWLRAELVPAIGK